jgi:hypothetical protein
VITSSFRGYTVIEVVPVSTKVTLSLHTKEEGDIHFPVIHYILAQKGSELVEFPVVVCEGEVVVFNKDDFEFFEGDKRIKVEEVSFDFKQ